MDAQLTRKAEHLYMAGILFSAIGGKYKNRQNIIPQNTVSNLFTQLLNECTHISSMSKNLAVEFV